MKLLCVLICLFLLVIPSGLEAQTVSGTVTLTATASDVTATVGDTECGVASVQFFNGATALGAPITSPTSGNDYVMSLNTRTMANGTYTITAKATDKAGTGTSAATLCDGSKPNIGTSAPITMVVNNAPPDSAAPSVTVIVIVTVP